MDKTYRNLSNQEVHVLEKQGCSSANWANVLVAGGFNAAFVKNSSFSGQIKVGNVGKLVSINTFTRPSGIYNSNIIDCTIGDDCYINNVPGQLYNQNLGNNVIVDNCYLIANSTESSFGNGVSVSVLNEAGGREVAIFDKLSAQLAYILTFYRYNETLISSLERIIEKYVTSKKSTHASIGSHSILRNCNEILGVNIGEGCELTSVQYLENGTINSSVTNPSIVGSGVIAKNFIIGEGVRVSEGANINKCFIGESTVVSKGFSIEESIVCSNGQFYNGEACAIFAGPHTVTHHKSTLLIGGAYSFFNAGSGTNQSNHLYKIGPVHQGVTERGVKTGSDSYILWPAHISCFTVVLGRHYNHPDIADLPFSYLIEKDGSSFLIPGLNFKSIGTYRDLAKWEKRDKRVEASLDIVDYDLTWYFIGKLVRGIEVMQKLKASKEAAQYVYNGVVISSSSLDGGIKIYQQALKYYIGLRFLAHQNHPSKLFSGVGMQKFENIVYPQIIDVAGMFAERNGFFEAINSIDATDSIETVNSAILNCRFSLEMDSEILLLKKYISDNYISEGDVKSNSSLFLKDFAESVKAIHSGILSDGKKEFNSTSGISFGIDGQLSDRLVDFKVVRGEVESQKEFLALKSTEVDLLSRIEGFSKEM